MNDKITAIVLSESDYRENDCLVQILSKEYGHLTLINKSSKKMTAKNRLFPMGVYEFIIDYKTGKDIFVARSKRFIKSYYEEKLENVSFKNIFLELSLKSKALDINIYEDLIFCLEHLSYASGTLFVAKLAHYYGIAPYVDGCVVCDDPKVIRVSEQMGGFVCIKHSPLKDNQDLTRLKKFRLVNKADYSNYQSLVKYNYDFSDFCLMMDFFLANSASNINAYLFLKRISNQ